MGTESFAQYFAQAKVTEWPAEIEHLAEIAKSHPQEAYAALKHGLAGRWVYLARTIQGIGPSFTSLERVIRCRLLPNLLGRPASDDTEWDLLTLPVRVGGLGIPSPSAIADTESSVSVQVTMPRASCPTDCQAATFTWLCNG